jgi:HlyD family secretion protein
MSTLFRQQAMAKVFSSEVPAAPLKVVGRSDWLMLIGAMAFTVVAVVWGFLGAVPTTVNGTGILLRKAGGTLAITAEGRGVVEAVLVETGAEVTKGQLIARLRVTGGEDKLTSAERKLSLLSRERDRLTSYWKENFPQQNADIDADRTATQSSLANANQAADAAKRELDAAAKLFRDGLTTKAHVDEVQQGYFNAVNQRDQLSAKLRDLDTKFLAVKNARDQALSQADLSVESAKADLAAIRDGLEEAMKVYAPSAGKVTEVAVNTGDYVAADTKLLVISYGASTLSALVYVPAAEVEWLQPGMVAHIAPGTVRPEEYGTALGNVVSVSPYPASEQAMARFLNNDNLVHSLVQSGPRNEIRIDLASDPATPSGLKWSSGRGPNVLVSEGSLTSADIVIRKQSPASLIIPALRRLLGVSAAAS